MIGVDCEEIRRFEGMSSTFENKVFTAGEIDYCKGKVNPEQHFAARFAAKEALIKAFGSVSKKVAFSDIEVLNEEGGCPKVNLLGIEGYDAKVSLTHGGGVAVAFALLNKLGCEDGR